MAADRILIVEDVKEDRNLIKYHLKKNGLENITEAVNGASALELLRSESFNLIIADRYMPELDGLALFKKIKEDSNLENIPFLMITSEHNREKILETMELGIRDYIIKPFDPVIMVDKIKRMLGIQ